jgi:phosphohistidine phosphatase
VIVVGHQPTLGRVAARLLAGRVGDLSIKKGSILWFSTRFDDEAREGATILRAVISPDFAE